MGIGLVTAGPLSDWIAMRLTLRNGGIREPEMRLPTMVRVGSNNDRTSGNVRRCIADRILLTDTIRPHYDPR